MRFSMAAAPVCVPTNSVGVFPFLQRVLCVHCVMLAILTIV